jgi:hypothetical protein
LRELQHQAEARPQLRLTAADDGLLLYSRQGAPLDPQTLVERDHLPDDVTPANFPLDAGIQIVGFTILPFPQPGLEQFDCVRVTAYSTVAAPTNVDLAVRCYVQAGDNEIVNSYAGEFQPLGESVWPIARWKPNRFYEDHYVILLPRGLAQGVNSVSFETRPIPGTPSTLP